LSKKIIIYASREAYKLDNRAQASRGFQAIQNENLEHGLVKITYASGSDMILDPPQRKVSDSELLDEIAQERNVERI